MAAVLKQFKQFCTLKNLTEILRGRTCLRNFAKINPSIRSLPRSHASPLKQTFCCYPYTRGYCRYSIGCSSNNEDIHKFTIESVQINGSFESFISISLSFECYFQEHSPENRSATSSTSTCGKSTKKVNIPFKLLRQMGLALLSSITKDYICTIR